MSILGVLFKEENEAESTNPLLHMTNLWQHTRITDGEDTSAGMPTLAGFFYLTRCRGRKQRQLL